MGLIPVMKKMRTSLLVKTVLIVRAGTASALTLIGMIRNNWRGTARR